MIKYAVFEKEEDLIFEQEFNNGWEITRINSELNIKNAFRLKSIFDDMIMNGCNVRKDRNVYL